jgi:hypothetical protein
MKTVEFEGTTHEFPDDFTEEEIRQALGGGQSAKPFPLGGPLRLPLQPQPATLADTLKGWIPEEIQQAKKVGGIIMHTADSPSEAADTGGLGGLLMGGASIGTPARSLAKAIIPSAGRSGAVLESIREAAKDVPIETEGAYNVIQRARELEAGGHKGLTEGMNKFSQALQPSSFEYGGQQVFIDPARIKYPQSFDFASAAKDVAANATKENMTGMMRGQVKSFAQALQDANRIAAGKVGMAIPFDRAMSEYHNAMRLQDAMTAAKKIGIPLAIAGGLGAGAKKAYGLYQSMMGQ